MSIAVAVKLPVYLNCTDLENGQLANEYWTCEIGQK